MAVKTLSQLRDLVESDLADSSNLSWSTAEVDRAIRQALYRYSQVRPLQVIGTLTAGNTREYSLTTLTGLIDVTAVWWPYDSSDPEYPPKWVDFELWDDNTILFLKSADRPNTGDDPLRVFYTTRHTIKDLDSATAGTYFEEDEEALVLGASAYAAVQRARYVTDTINATSEVPASFKAWARDRMKEFEQELERIGRRVIRHYDSRVRMLGDV